MITIVAALAVLALAALVVGLCRPTTHAAVGTTPRPDGLYERCSCGAERPCGRGERWSPRFRRH